MSDQQTGTLYGLGIGPGDPDLITLKALKILQSVKVIAYLAADQGPSLARTIAAPHIPDGLTEMMIRTAMIPGDDPNHDVYDQYAEDIAGHLKAGRDVAVLCEGDPFFYGSFMYLFNRLSGDFATQVVPGVTSPMAAAATAGLPLVSRKEILTVLPGPLDDENLRARLKQGGTFVIMKVGRHLGRVKDILTGLNLLGRACYVERATMAEEKILPLCQVEGDHVPYFSMILISAAEKFEDHD